jgi:hypothetical protein
LAISGISGVGEKPRSGGARTARAGRGERSFARAWRARVLRASRSCASLAAFVEQRNKLFARRPLDRTGQPQRVHENDGDQLRTMEINMEYRAISFAQKFRLFDEQWQPKVIAEFNDYQFKIVKLYGDFNLAFSQGY